MREYLSKTRFINAIVRDHMAIDAKRKEQERVLGHPRESPPKYLRLILDNHPEGIEIVIRGNLIGTHWMMLDKIFPSDEKGRLEAYLAATKIAFEAAKRIREKSGEAARIGLPEVVEYD